MKVKVNADACIGCGVCISAAPDVFAFSADGKSEVIGEVTDTAAIMDVVASCPVAAIEVEE